MTFIAFWGHALTHFIQCVHSDSHTAVICQYCGSYGFSSFTLSGGCIRKTAGSQTLRHIPHVLGSMPPVAFPHFV